jgi:hypothetical protein
MTSTNSSNSTTAAMPPDISGWRFTDGISFTFPANTIIPAKGYLVVAKNKERLLDRYPNLTDQNTVGNYSGNLANSGERIALGSFDTTDHQQQRRRHQPHLHRRR